MDIDVMQRQIRDLTDFKRRIEPILDRVLATAQPHDQGATETKLSDHEARLTAIEAALTAPKPKASDGNDQRGREARSGATGDGREDR